MTDIPEQEINIIIENGNVWPRDEEILFGEGDVIHRRPAETTFPDLLVEFGFFPSKSQARKAGTFPIEIPEGFFIRERIGKRRRGLFIWKPAHWDGS